MCRIALHKRVIPAKRFVDLLSSSFTSPGQRHLLDVSLCAVYATSHAPSFQLIPTTKIQALPELDEWLEGCHFQHFAYSKTWEEARSDPCMILHTSGTIDESLGTRIGLKEYLCWLPR